jgi:hypothetical protein
MLESVKNNIRVKIVFLLEYIPLKPNGYYIYQLL